MSERARALEQALQEVVETIGGWRIGTMGERGGHARRAKKQNGELFGGDDAGL